MVATHMVSAQSLSSHALAATVVCLPVSGPNGRLSRGPGPRAVWRPGTGPASAVIYRRRRLMAAALFLGTLVAGGWVLGVLGGGPLTASEAGSTGGTVVRELEIERASARTYVVRPGDTLWSIARSAQPEGDIRPLVDALAAFLHGRPLQAGDRIYL